MRWPDIRRIPPCGKKHEDAGPVGTDAFDRPAVFAQGRLVPKKRRRLWRHGGTAARCMRRMRKAQIRRAAPLWNCNSFCKIVKMRGGAEQGLYD